MLCVLTPYHSSLTIQYLIFAVLTLVNGKPWHRNIVVQYSQTLASSGNLSECWICHLTPASTFGKIGDPTVIPVSNFLTVYNLTVDFINSDL